MTDPETVIPLAWRYFFMSQGIISLYANGVRVRKENFQSKQGRTYWFKLFRSIAINSDYKCWIEISFYH